MMVRAGDDATLEPGRASCTRSDVNDATGRHMVWAHRRCMHVPTISSLPRGTQDAVRFTERPVGELSVVHGALSLKSQLLQDLISRILGGAGFSVIV